MTRWVRPPYDGSHVGAGKAAAYDREFWTEGTVKAQNWALERVLLRRILDDVMPQRALDFACGSGRVLAELEGSVPQTVGLDISPDMLALAQRRCPGSRLFCADVTDPSGRVPDLGAPFDLITAFRFLLNAQPQLRQAVLRYLRSCLAPDGLLVANFHLNPHSARGTYLLARWGGTRRTAMLSPGDITRLLDDAGFAVVDLIGYEYLPFRRDGLALRAPHLRARVERALLDRPLLRPVAASHLVLARPG